MSADSRLTRSERRAVASLALLYSFRMLGLFMVLPLLALYAVDLPGASPALIGLALGAYGLSQACLQIPLGWLSDRVGRRPVILAGLAIFALGSLVAALSGHMVGVVIGRFLQGAGAIAGSVMALVADLTRDEQRTKAMALVGASIGMSFAVALVLGPLIAGVFGLAGVFGTTAGLAVLGIAIVLLWVPEPDPATRSGEVGARRGLMGQVLADPVLRRLNLGVFSLHFILTASFLAIPRLLEATLALERGDHWKAYLPILLLSLLGMLPLLRLAERHGRIRFAVLSAIAGLLIAIAGMTLSALPAVFLLALWLYFVCVNYLEAAMPSLVSKSVFAGGKGTALGVYSTCQFLGAFCGGAVGGWVQQHGGLGALFILCVVPGLGWLWSSRHLSMARAPAAGVAAS